MENKENIIEIVQNSITNRNNTININKYDQLVKDNAWKHEMYRSYYSFDKTFESHVKENKSVKGFDGLTYIDRIIIDLDRGNINKNSFNGYVINCITEILDKGIMGEDINVWFSGTGYHIELLNVFGLQPSKELNEKLRYTMKEYFDFGDSIYDKTRIIRSNWSLNKKTNLFKIWIPLQLLHELSFDDIKKAATSKENYMKLVSSHQNFFETLNESNHVQPYLQSMIIASPTIVSNGDSNKGDVSTVVSCMQHVFNEGPVKGSRNMKVMRMASSYKRAGIPFLVTLNGMLTWSKDSISEDEVTRTVTNIYEENYQYGCMDHIMAEYCDPKCIYFKRKDYTQEIKNILELEDSLRSYIRNDLTSNSINLSSIWNVPNYHFKPGELIIISGDTGLGKSAFVQNIITHCKKETLFLSLEMKEQLTFRRFIQIVTKQNEKYVIDLFKNDDNVSFEENLKHVNIMSIAPRVEAVKKVVAEMEPKVLVIDTTDELQVDFVRGEIEKQNIIIDNLKQMAQKNNIIIIAVHHLNKMSAATNTINVHSLKGSSNIVQKADKVLLIKGNRNETVRTICSEKSRDEARFEMTANFDGETMTFSQITF